MTSSRGCVVLAGGHGSRLGGVNKALLEVRGVRIVDRALLAIRPSVEEVVLVVNDDALEPLNIPLFYDPQPHAGVLPALLTGLQASSSELCLVTACDMPFIQTSLVTYLFQVCEEHDVCLPHTGGRPEPMFAVYRREPCVQAIRDTLDRGQMRMIAFLDDLRVARLDEPELRTHDPELLSFFNVNEANDLAQAQEIAARLEASR
ncbi:MAG TPA: molybdenum cofactor guanylyltransferase [Chloroflexota bacterium]|jgi:molybdopterin-guanine dinucleotide biosynthesis protein A|nr:molybdenum cofactor guanylyltransferase [Chloroflexota bacterium]